MISSKNKRGRAIWLVFLIVSVISLSIASAYICIDPVEDNQEVIEFKVKINQLAIKEDIKNGLSENQVLTKLKYFNPCN